MPQNNAVLFEVEDKIATLTLNRPEAMNAFNGAIRKGLASALKQIISNPDIRAVIVTGAGEKSFCAGLDLKMATTGEGMEGLLPDHPPRSDFEVQQEVRDMYTAYEQLPVPVIAAINGYCFGMGMQLTLVCDIRICSENAIFTMPELQMGTLPDCGGTQRLPRMVGVGKAKELIYTGRRIDATEALRIGLVQHVYPNKEKLMEEALKLVKEMVAISPTVMMGAKRVLNASMSYSLEMGLDYETTNVCYTRQDLRAGSAELLKKAKSK